MPTAAPPTALSVLGAFTFLSEDTDILTNINKNKNVNYKASKVFGPYQNHQFLPESSILNVNHSHMKFA